MNKYIEDMGIEELKELIAINAEFKHQLYEYAYSAADTYVGDYLYGLSMNGADYLISPADRGSFFIILEDGNDIYNRYEYYKFRDWFVTVQSTYGFLDDWRSNEIIGAFLKQADKCWNMYYVDEDVSDEDMDDADEVLCLLRTEAGWHIRNRLLAEYDFCDEDVIDFVDVWTEEHSGAYADECGAIYIDVPAHTERIA